MTKLFIILGIVLLIALCALFLGAICMALAGEDDDHARLEYNERMQSRAADAEYERNRGAQ